jgi:flagellar biogenesis protein FliO
LANEPTTPARKRPVRAATRSAAPKRAPRVSRAVLEDDAPTTNSRAVLEDDAATTNYALRFMDDAVAESTVRRGLRPSPPAVEDDSFALRLTEALEAINAAQTDSRLPQGETARSAGEGGALADEVHSLSAAGAPLKWSETLDKLPPIRLPIGPAIPWRLGLPVLAAIVIVMAVVGRPSGNADKPVQLPAQQTYPVQDEAPLFAKPQPAEATSAQPTQSAQSIGVQDAPGIGFDLVDIGLKLVVVLALAYGSLMLLRRAGVGGAGSGRGSDPAQALQVVSSLALAQNRSVHVIKVPGGRTLVVGATPTAVNLIAELGGLE